MKTLSLRVAVFLTALSAIVLAAAPARAAAAPEGPVVRQIVVQGFRGAPSVITDLMQTKQGARLDIAVLNKDVSRLLQAGYVATVRRTRVPDGVRIIVSIVEGLRVTTVKVTGAGRSWNRKLLAELITQANTPVSAALLRLPEPDRFKADKERIKAYCQQRGYRAVTVVAETTPVAGTDNIQLLLRVRLGPKHQVHWLRFEGNKGVATRELRKRMQTKRDTFFTSRRYYDRFFEEDIIGVQDFYRFKGYPNAKVTYRRAFRGRRGNKVDITIIVEEGQQYPVGKLAVAGNKFLSTDTLLAASVLKPGTTYSDETLIQSRSAMARLYEEAGYPFVRIAPRRQLTAKGDAFDVVFQVDEGDRITINTVRTSGHPRTRREVILRELELEPGMLYDVRKLERSNRALDRLQYFDELTIKLVPTDPPTPGERDLLVNVTEGRTGFFRFGVGFSSANAFIGAIELTQRNFDWRDKPKDWSDVLSGNAYVGAGQLFRISLMPGTVYSNYLLQYNNPYWKGRNESFGWRLYYRNRDQGEWDERRIGIRLSRGLRKYKGDPDTDLVFHTRIEAVTVSNVDETEASEDADDEEGTHPLVGLGVTLRRDRTDRVTLPTSGYRWDGGPELVIPHGLKFGAGGTRFWTIGKRPKGHERVFSIRGRADYALGSFPIYERYYAGAPLIRGFEYRGAGPHDNDEPDGGKYRAIVSAEYRYPLVARTLYTVLFADTGTVTDNFSLFGSPRVAIGIGFRLVIPQISRAPLSIDFGFPVVKDSDDDTEVLYFSLSLDR